MNNVYKFEASKGNYRWHLVLSIIVPLSYMLFLNKYSSMLLPLSSVTFLPFVFLLWIYLTTSYVIQDKSIFYRSAFIRGSFLISSITEIRLEKRPERGQRPAMANKGMLIIYGDNQKVFIAPSKPHIFLNTIRKINKNVIVTHSSK